MSVERDNHGFLLVDYCTYVQTGTFMIVWMDSEDMMPSPSDDGSSQTLKIRGMDCCLHSWNTDSSKEQPRALIVIYHGFLAHGKYPTVRYAAELLAANNYAVTAADMPGHGKSPGLRGYLPSSEVLIQDGLAIAEHATNIFSTLPLFLVGSSMGGTVALSVANELGTKVAGVILLAPLLAIHVREPARYVLKALSSVIPTLKIIPSSSTSAEKQYRDPQKRKECEEDELSIPGSTIRVGSASTCVELAKEIHDKFSSISCPFLCLIGTQDAVVDNTGSLELMKASPSHDKTLKKYEALHGLLCEPSPLVDRIHGDVLTWLDEHST